MNLQIAEQKNLEIASFGITRQEAIRLGICVQCRCHIRYQGEINMREYFNSGKCNECRDK